MYSLAFGAIVLADGANLDTAVSTTRAAPGLADVSERGLAVTPQHHSCTRWNDRVCPRRDMPR
jgi:hypothetical protein